MNRQDIEKLLGGYATDSLTAEERAALFAAALEDQHLFDQLAREESLRQVLREPGARAELLSALEARAEPWCRRFARWLGRPAGLASAAAALAGVTLAIVVSHQLARPKPVTVAEVRAPSEYMAPRPQTPPAASQAFSVERDRSSNLPGAAGTAPAKGANQASPAEPARPSAVPDAAERPAVEHANRGSTPGQPRPAAAPGAPAPATAEELMAARRSPAAEPKELAKVRPMAVPPAAATGGGGVASGVVGGIVNAPRAEEMAAAPPPMPARQKDANEVRVVSDAAAPRAMQAMDARAMFNAAPSAPSFGLRQEQAETKVTTAESAPSPAQSRPPVARMRMAAPRAASAEPATAVNRVPPPYLGLRYRVLRRDPEGAFSTVDPDTVFRTGDQVRVIFEPNDAGYLYLFERETAGAWRLLASDRVERLAAYQVPRTGAMRDQEPGVRRLYAVFSRRADTALAGTDPAALEARLGASLLKQKPGDQQGRGDRDVYVVNAGEPSQSQQVVVEVTLTVR